MLRFIRSLRPTPLGMLLVAILLAAIVVILSASGALEVAGWVVAMVVVLMLVGGAPLTPQRGASLMTSLRSGRSLSLAAPEQMDEAPVDEAAWRRERERREGKLD